MSLKDQRSPCPHSRLRSFGFFLVSHVRARVCACRPHGTTLGCLQARRVGAPFAGYTNGDIAFDSSLIDVLRGVAEAIEEKLLSSRVLVVGKRLNIANAEQDADELIKIGKRFPHKTTRWKSERRWERGSAALSISCALKAPTRPRAGLH